MYIINKEIEHIEIIKNSKFICIIKYIDSEKNVKNVIEESKKKYKNASHYTYAYIIDKKEKCSDDKEPRGTAGLPILNVLKNNNITNTIIIIIRYFGGIKLGSGGLIRAYSKVASNGLKTCDILEYISYKTIKITFQYENENKILHIIKNFEIINKNYSDEIEYTIEIPINQEKKLTEKLNKYTNKKTSN